MTAADALAALRPWIEKHARPAWRPVVEAFDGAPGDSKFAGTPLLKPGEDWPACRACGGAMESLLQLDLSALPPELRGRRGGGVLQLFYCTSPGREESGPVCNGGVAMGPFDAGGTSLCRVLPAGVGVPAGRARGRFPPKRIVGWERFHDCPDPEEHSALGLVTNYRSGPFGLRTPRPTAVICEGVELRAEPADDLAGLVDAITEEVAAADGDKLAGWPHWAQAADYPDCPACGARMEPLFQLDSAGHVPFYAHDWDWILVHVTRCPTHEGVVTFEWTAH